MIRDHSSTAQEVRCAQSFMRALVATLLLLRLALVRNALINFSGNIATDFWPYDSFTLPDKVDFLTPCGFDVLNVSFSYDQATDTGFFGSVPLRCVLAAAMTHCPH